MRSMWRGSARRATRTSRERSAMFTISPQRTQRTQRERVFVFFAVELFSSRDGQCRLARDAGQGADGDFQGFVVGAAFGGLDSQAGLGGRGGRVGDQALEDLLVKKRCSREGRA